MPTPTVEPTGAVLDRLLTTIEDGNPEALRGLRTGYPRLGPPRPRSPPRGLYILAGRPGMGKGNLRDSRAAVYEDLTGPPGAAGPAVERVRAAARRGRDSRRPATTSMTTTKRNGRPGCVGMPTFGASFSPRPPGWWLSRLVGPLAPALLPFAKLVDAKGFPPGTESFGRGEPTCRDFPPQR